MNALAALLTSDFHASNWTDQEIGIALGKGAPVISVRVSADPYGFIGKHQAILLGFSQPPQLADAIAKALIRQRKTEAEMRRALVAAWSTAFSEANVLALCDLIVFSGKFTDDERQQIHHACLDNEFVASKPDVVKRVLSSIGMPEPVMNAFDDIPF
jgi:hypothetical protein